MSRPRKAGLSYFPLDVNIFEDKDVRILIERYGAAGFALYTRILCLTYGNDGYFLVIDDDWEYLIAKDIKCSRESVKQMTTYLLGRSLLVRRTVNGLTCKSSILTESVTIVTSPGIQRRYQCAVAERGRKNAVTVDGRIWLLGEAETLPFIKVSGRESFSGNNESFSGNNESFSGNNDIKKSKVKKRKEENTYTPSASDIWIEDPDVNASFVRYIGMRAGGGRFTRTQAEALREQLLAMSSDPAEQVRIVDQSTRGGWKNFYPLEDRSGQRPVKKMSGIDGFRNYEQRSYDYQALERQLLGGVGS